MPSITLGTSAVPLSMTTCPVLAAWIAAARGTNHDFVPTETGPHVVQLASMMSRTPGILWPPRRRANLRGLRLSPASCLLRFIPSRPIAAWDPRRCLAVFADTSHPKAALKSPHRLQHPRDRVTNWKVGLCVTSPRCWGREALA